MMNDPIQALENEYELAKSEIDDYRTEIQRLLLANETLTALNAEYAERIKALEAKGEAVAYITQAALESITSGRCSSAKVWANPRSRFDDITLYTTPPSVDALIAELGQLQTPILVSEIDAVLDKYRSAK